MIAGKGGIGKEGDRKGRLYYDAAMQAQTFLVEATLAVAFFPITQSPYATTQKRAGV